MTSILSRLLTADKPWTTPYSVSAHNKAVYSQPPVASTQVMAHQHNVVSGNDFPPVPMQASRKRKAPRKSPESSVRFGRVPKREKAKILAAMQKVNASSQEKALGAEIEDELRLMTTIVHAHKETCDFTRDKVLPVFEKARTNPRYVASLSTWSCPFNPAPENESADNANYQEPYAQKFFPAILGVVEFAKRLPGFGFLSNDDQITLLKSATFEVLLVRLACMFDSDSLICLNGQILCRDTLEQHSPPNSRFLGNSLFDFAEILNSFHLSDNEIGLFSAVVVFAADRPGLRSVDTVLKVQKKMMDILRKTLTANHPEYPNIYEDLMKKIDDLRTFNALHSERLCDNNRSRAQAQGAMNNNNRENAEKSNDSPCNVISSEILNQFGSAMNINGLPMEARSQYVEPTIRHVSDEEMRRVMFDIRSISPPELHIPRNPSKCSDMGPRDDKVYEFHEYQMRRTISPGQHSGVSSATTMDVVANFARNPHHIVSDVEMRSVSPDSHIQNHGIASGLDLRNIPNGNHMQQQFSHPDANLRRTTSPPGQHSSGSSTSSGISTSSNEWGVTDPKDDRDLVRSPESDSGHEGSPPSDGHVHSPPSDGSAHSVGSPPSDGNAHSVGSPPDVNSSEEELKSPPRSTRYMSTNYYMVDESVANHTMVDYHQNFVKRPDHHDHGSSSDGDEGVCVDAAPTKSGPVFPKLLRVESPIDSGIERGRSISPPSPPSHEEEKTQVKPYTIEDMPVLKRALQAPPILNPTKLMDEAYRNHKKFSRVRREAVAPYSANQMSLASTHSTLVRTLEQAPRYMSEQQLKRTDLLHNIIMQKEHLPGHHQNHNHQAQQSHHIDSQFQNSNHYAYSSVPSSNSSPVSPQSSSYAQTHKGLVVSSQNGYLVPQHTQAYTSASWQFTQASSTISQMSAAPAQVHTQYEAPSHMQPNSPPGGYQSPPYGSSTSMVRSPPTSPPLVINGAGLVHSTGNSYPGKRCPYNPTGDSQPLNLSKKLFCPPTLKMES